MRRLRKSLRPQTIKICYLFNILRSYVNELKRRINSEWASLSQAVTVSAVGELRQRLRVAFVLEAKTKHML